MNHKYETLWQLKKYKLCIVCTLILSNPLHLIVGSRLISLKVNFEFQNVMQIKKKIVCV
jgi:hypothetical protein